MIIELPKNFTMNNEQQEEVARVNEEGILELTFKAPFRKVMTEIAYEMKGRERCCYCGKHIKSGITIDHMYPQDFGGPTIPNNLLPSCKKCNNEKGNLTSKQYKRFLMLKKVGKEKEYLHDLAFHLQYIRKWEGHEIPKEWTFKKPITDIIVRFDLTDNYMGKKYNSVSKFYERYGHFQNPIIVDKNNFLLDGFISLMYAKNNNIQRLPVIVLENVICIH